MRRLRKSAYDVTAGRTAEDAIFVLHADDIGVGEIEEIGRAEVGIDLLLFNFEADFGRVFVALWHVVDRDDETIRTRVLGGDRGAQVVGEGRNAASSWQVIADERDLLDLAGPFHRVSEARSMQGKRRVGRPRGSRGVFARSPPWRGSEPIRPLS